MSQKNSSTLTPKTDLQKAAEKAAKKARKAQEALAAAEAAAHQEDVFTAPAPLPETADGVNILLTQGRVAQHLGVSPRTLEGWRFKKNGGLRYVKIGGRVRYRARDVNEFVDSLFGDGRGEEGAHYGTAS